MAISTGNDRMRPTKANSLVERSPILATQVQDLVHNSTVLWGQSGHLLVQDINRISLVTPSLSFLLDPHLYSLATVVVPLPGYLGEAGAGPDNRTTLNVVIWSPSAPSVTAQGRVLHATDDPLGAGGVIATGVQAGDYWTFEVPLTPATLPKLTRDNTISFRIMASIIGNASVTTIRAGDISVWVAEVTGSDLDGAYHEANRVYVPDADEAAANMPLSVDLLRRMDAINKMAFAGNIRPVITRVFTTIIPARVNGTVQPEDINYAACQSTLVLAPPALVSSVEQVDQWEFLYFPRQGCYRVFVLLSGAVNAASDADLRVYFAEGEDAATITLTDEYTHDTTQWPAVAGVTVPSGPGPFRLRVDLETPDSPPTGFAVKIEGCMIYEEYQSRRDH
jgi:hypothetical protein